MAIAEALEENSYVINWLGELQGAATEAAALTPAARAAVVALIDSFGAEDGFLPQAAQQARATLTSARTVVAARSLRSA